MLCAKPYLRKINQKQNLGRIKHTCRIAWRGGRLFSMKLLVWSTLHKMQRMPRRLTGKPGKVNRAVHTLRDMGDSTEQMVRRNIAF